MQCALCSLLTCIPGFYSSGCRAGATRDAVCLPCDDLGMPNGTFAWTSECGFECLPGAWLNGTACSVCSEPTCDAGFTPSKCFDSEDTRCVPCVVGTGHFSWTHGCDFRCDDGFWLDATTRQCVVCSVPECSPGWFASNCSAASDARCSPCVRNDAELVAWTHDCEFQCVDGAWYNGSECVRCSTPSCQPGFYAAGCSGQDDTRCEACTPPGPSFEWRSGCSYTCGSGFFDAGSSCDVCTAAPSDCAPGTYAANCTRERDSFCASCGGIDTSIMRWTRGCDYECLDGFYMDAGVCMGCTRSLSCAPGFRASACTHWRDAECEACPPAGPGSVWTFECVYACAAGFFQNGSACVPCDEAACAPGSYRMECSTFSDAECVGCQAPPGGAPYEWTEGCAFRCVEGSSYLSGGGCVECSALECAAGTYGSRCTPEADAACLECEARPYPVVWVDGCVFHCAPGYFKTDAGDCRPCTLPGRCSPGTYLAPCSSIQDARCLPCAPVDGAVWTEGCDFACDTGRYRDAGRCAACSYNLTCAPGSVPVACAPEADAACTPCPQGSVAGLVFTQGCDFRCDAGYFSSGISCIPCSGSLACGPGSYASPCGVDLDSICVACDAPAGPYAWTSGCEFVCADGYAADLNGTRCVPAPPRVFSVVQAVVAMQNTLDEICFDMDAILSAMSDALFAVSQTRFVTNVTALDGRACVDNVCPQCREAQLGRRLLASGVSMTTSSVSVQPVTQAPQTVQLAGAFQSILSNSTSLLAGPVTTTLRMVVVVTEVPSSSPLWRRHMELWFGGIAVGCFAVVAALCLLPLCRRRAVVVTRRPSPLLSGVRIDTKRP